MWWHSWPRIMNDYCHYPIWDPRQCTVMLHARFPGNLRVGQLYFSLQLCLPGCSSWHAGEGGWAHHSAVVHIAVEQHPHSVTLKLGGPREVGSLHKHMFQVTIWPLDQVFREHKLGWFLGLFFFFFLGGGNTYEVASESALCFIFSPNKNICDFLLFIMKRTK